jgi:hypothetical protein
MPSIRVKRSRYESLRDHPEAATTTGRPRSRTLNDILGTSIAPVQSPSSASVESHHSTASGYGTEAVRLRRTSRPDSSKVHNHVLHGSWSITGARAGRHHRRSLSTFEEGGPSATRPYEHLGDRNFDAETAPGRETAALYAEPESHYDEHHEHVVEHLEVIGVHIGSSRLVPL